MPSGKSKKTHSKGRKTKLHKRGVRKIFSARHIDQVWEDVRKTDGVHDGKVGPLGTTDKVELDEDLPAHGQHFCIACSRYFINETALQDHLGTKPHRRRVKELMGARPHNQADADWAAGMGAPDNGPRSGGGGVASMDQ
ncbi:zinc finger 593 [Chlorella sorokiniana]|uniref:Zinc finger 593 n=1 Tax=Chlorella sorokiniana TaxID=3076 RepID=A0A2P6U3S0_CHLSO|nr:zinc finger 593 [Chlorella sorokiniana]|eukprot:PRW60962.1 zinc finger 593 [Chlorella sorokiniana]